MKILSDEQGQTTTLVACFMAFLFLGLSALAIDVGMLYREKRMVQAAADAAAIAASAQYSSARTAVTTSAQAAAQQQAGGVLASEVTASLVNSSTADVKVVISHATNTFFLGAFRSSMSTINVSAMAEVAIPPPTAGLNGNTVTLNSGASVTDAAGSNCGINDNDTDGSALNLNSGVTVNVGSFTDHGTAENKNCGSCTTYNPMPTTGAATVPDPFASLTAPAQPTTSYPTSTLSANTTLNPGYYPNTINFNSGSGAYTVTLNPGLYYFGGGFNADSNVTIQGTGVTLFFPSGAAVNMNTSATFNLSAPTSALDNCASCAGMLIWQPAGSLTLDASSSSSWGGAVYVPNGTLTLNGGATATAYGMIFANSIMLNSAITLSCPSNGGKLRLVQ